MLNVRFELESSSPRPPGKRLRTPTIFLAALVLAAGIVFAGNELSSAASSSPNTIQACVKGKSGAARIVSAGKRCKRGERAVTWARVGQIGKSGPAGAPGQNGARGPTGATGAAGPTGAKGATGATGQSGLANFNDLQGMPCTRDSQQGTIDLSFTTGGLVRPRCRLPGDGPVCGDGVTEGSEQCDDGNTNPTDGCTNTCTTATCGDGVVHVGTEECDSSGTDTASCNGSTCTVSRCGDGHVNQMAGEQCDAGGADTASCTRLCTVTSCGDGYTNHAAGEQCDDGNQNNTDGCDTTCHFTG